MSESLIALLVGCEPLPALDRGAALADVVRANVHRQHKGLRIDVEDKDRAGLLGKCGRFYFPVNAGARFSTKCATPSLKSCESKLSSMALSAATVASSSVSIRAL